MDPDRLRLLLEEYGTVRIRAIPADEPIVLRRHDTEIVDETVVVRFADGELQIPVRSIGSVSPGGRQGSLPDA